MNARLRRILGNVRNVLQVRWVASKGVESEGRLRLHGFPRIYLAPASRIILGDGVVLTGRARRNTLEARGACLLRTIRPGARIVVGADTGMTSVTISATLSVIIGKRVLLGTGVLITDSDHHDLTVADEQRRWAPVPEPSPAHAVLIGDDVFVGARSLILKGCSIGAGSIIGAGSVVTGSIPAGVIAAGNPCRVVRVRSS